MASGLGDVGDPGFASAAPVTSGLGYRARSCLLGPGSEEGTWLGHVHMPVPDSASSGVVGTSGAGTAAGWTGAAPLPCAQGHPGIAEVGAAAWGALSHAVHQDAVQACPPTPSYPLSRLSHSPFLQEAFLGPSGPKHLPSPGAAPSPRGPPPQEQEGFPPVAGASPSLCHLPAQHLGQAWCKVNTRVPKTYTHFRCYRYHFPKLN